MQLIADLPFLDYSEESYQVDPFKWLAEKGKHHRIARSERGVELLDYQLCRSFLLNRSFGTDHANLVEKMGLPESRALVFKRRMLLVQNRNDIRKRIRGVLTSLIGPKQASAMQSEIAGVVKALVDGLGLGQLDLKHAFADLVPAGVYCSWVDAPLSDARFVADHSEQVLAIFRRDPSLTESIVTAYDRMFAHAKTQLAKRREDMGEDFLSQLIRAREAGDMSEGELEDFAVMLMEAANDNTAHQITIAIDRLSRIPDVWTAIGKDASLAPKAVCEVMRLWPRSISTSRFALEDTEVDGVHIPYGTTVFASFGTAQRQADVFDNPHEFDLNRPKNPPHMNFGGGVFSCLGQFVAVIEVEQAIAQIAQRFPNLRVVERDIEYNAMFQMVRSLTVDLGQKT